MELLNFQKSIQKITGEPRLQEIVSVIPLPHNRIMVATNYGLYIIEASNSIREVEFIFAEV